MERWGLIIVFTGNIIFHRDNIICKRVILTENTAMRSARMQKILIIDENQEEAELLEVVLREEYQVTAVSTAKEGLSCAETGEYSLIFLDAAMQEMEDFRLLKEIQGKIMPWHISVILLLDDTEMKKEEKGLVLGAADFIVRPVYPLVVKAKARTYISLYQFRKKEEEQSALTDALTGVSSRKCYDLNSVRKWQEAIRLNAYASVCVFDVDKFRTYNERYGYPAGDKALTSIAEAIASKLARNTDFIARYENDRFVAVILGGEGGTVFTHMKNICKTVKGLHIPHWDSASGWLSVSIGGVTVVPSMEDSYDTYFKIAQNMLSDAKNAGRNQIVWMDENGKQLREDS